jgi:hypothetical protein
MESLKSKDFLKKEISRLQQKTLPEFLACFSVEFGLKTVRSTLAGVSTLLVCPTHFRPDRSYIIIP